MNSPVPSLISRYYIIFFEKFLQKVPSTPPSILSKWYSFKELLKQTPISIESVHRVLTDMFECDHMTPLDHLERLLNENNMTSNNLLIKIESPLKIIKQEDLINLKFLLWNPNKI